MFRMLENEKSNLTSEIEFLRKKVARLESLEKNHHLNNEKLQASEHRYRDLVNTINSGVCVYEVINDGQSGDDYIIKEFNRTALEAEGFIHEQIVGKSLKEIRPNIDDFGLIPIFREVWKTGVSAFYPATVYVDNKFSNYYENRVFRLPNGELIAVYDDVSEKENMAARLLETKERFDQALNATQDGLFDWNLVTNQIYYSPNWKRMLGYGPDELADDFSLWETHTKAEDVQRSWAMQQELINRQRDRFEMEFKMKHKDGHWVDILSRAAAIFDEEGKAVRIVGTHVDISENKRAQEREKEALARLRLAMESADEGVWEWDFSNDHVTFDRAALKMVGYDEEFDAKESQYWVDQVHEDDRQMVAENYEAFLSGQIEKYNVEFRFKHRNGGYVWIASTARIIRMDAKGKPLLVAGIHRDITDRMEHDKEKEILQAQLVQAQKMESVGRLAGGVAHDFNNKLSVIQGYTELSLSDIDESHPLRSNLEEILKATLHSGAITKQLLAFARKQTIAPTVLDLNETVSGMLKMLQRLIGEEITLAWFPGCNLMTVKLDSTQLDQIMANLVVNARDAISGMGRITIETVNVELDQAFCDLHPGSQPGPYVHLSVSDDGEGMDEVTCQNIFEPFYTTKSTGQGTGLGMSMVYGIVMQNQGIISVQSEPGNGTTFQIFLPGEKGLVGGLELPGSLGIPTGQGESILVVEDEEAIMKMASVMLENLGYKVTGACLPEEALRLVEKRESPFHLLLSDVVLPQMNGRQLADRLAEKMPQMKILFMSGYTADVIAHRGVLDESVDFINKPFSLKDLGQKVRLILDRP